MLTFISDCYKDQNMCKKAVDNYVYALGSAPDCYKNQKCVIKLSVFTLLRYIFFPDQFKTQEMCDKAVDTCLFVLDSVPD